MRTRAARPARLLIWTGLATALASQAHAQVRGVLDVSLQGTAASDPFLEESADEGTIAVGLQIDPSVYYSGGEATTAALRGSVAVDQYDASHGTVGSVGLNAGVQHRASTRTTLGVSASARSSRSAVRDFLRNPALSGGAPGAFFPGSLEGSGNEAQAGPNVLPDEGLPSGLDLNLTEEGAGVRVNNYQVGASLRRTLDPLSAVSLGGSVGFNSSDGARGSDYRTDRFTASYNRRLSSRTDVIADVSGGRADYEEDAGGLGHGDGTFITPTVGVSHRLSETVVANASAGASIIKVDRFDGRSISEVGFAGSAGLCRLHASGSLCFNASRSAQPTSFGGITTVSSALAAYSRTIGPKDNIQASAGFSRRDASLLQFGEALNDAQSVVAVTGGYSRKLAERIYAFVRPSYSKIFGGTLSEDRENYQISLGVRYRFGEME